MGELFWIARCVLLIREEIHSEERTKTSSKFISISMPDCCLILKLFDAATFLISLSHESRGIDQFRILGIGLKVAFSESVSQSVSQSVGHSVSQSVGQSSL